MDKLYYVIKTLSRTKRKDWENYVVNAVWNRLGDWDIKPVSQQYIRKDGKAYLIDLYFPQVNIGVECDEAHHLRNEGADYQREIAITDYLDQVSEEKADSYKAIHIKNHYDADEGKQIMELAEFEAQIDACVKQIKAAVARKKAAHEFCEWADPVIPKQYFCGKEKISVNDKVGFGKVVDICNDLFGSDYGGMQKSYFIPSAMRKRHGDEYILWCPKLAIEDKAVARGWNNQLSEDGLTITQYSEISEVSGPERPEEKRVTFAQVKDPITGCREYRFFGVFKFGGMKDGKEIYTRCADSFAIFG